MPFPLIPLLVTAGSAVGGALAGRKGARTQEQSATQSGSVIPIEDPRYKGLGEALMRRFLSALSTSGLPEGFEAAGIGKINETWDAAKQGLENTLTARGLGSSPVAGAALARADVGRAGDITRFRTVDIPSMARAWQLQDAQNALQFYSMRPIGQKTQGTTTGQVVFPGGVGAGAVTSMAEMLAYLWGKGAFS